MPDPDFLGMSDDEFLNQALPDSDTQPGADAGASDSLPSAQENQDTLEGGSGEDTQQGEETLAASESDATETVEGGAGEDSLSGSNTDPAADPAKGQDTVEASGNKEATGEEPKDPSKDPSKDTSKLEAPAVDYKTSYEKLMAPFKANGKTIELKSPEEAIALMQMGANYTRKMQEIAPHRKVLLMLENNGLLDEGKLSYLIDLDKKNPEAIKKLVKDAGLDPMEIDTNAEPAYQGGNHRVTDEEANFKTAIEDIKSVDGGFDTLRTINDSWDQASKEELWKHPEILSTIHSQRENGIYGRITAELDRQRTLGKIAPTVPFIQAYLHEGNELQAKGGFADLAPAPAVTTPPPPKPAPAPIATRTAAPKATVKNDDKAAAAATTRTTPASAKGFVNPLSMSDDEFLSTFAGRV